MRGTRRPLVLLLTLSYSWALLSTLCLALAPPLPWRRTSSVSNCHYRSSRMRMLLRPPQHHCSNKNVVIGWAAANNEREELVLDEVPATTTTTTTTTAGSSANKNSRILPPAAAAAAAVIQPEKNEQKQANTYPIDAPSPLLLAMSMVLVIASIGMYFTCTTPCCLLVDRSTRVYWPCKIYFFSTLGSPMCFRSVFHLTLFSFL
jgi:hypothetical protein